MCKQCSHLNTKYGMKDGLPRRCLKHGISQLITLAVKKKVISKLTVAGAR